MATRKIKMYQSGAKKNSLPGIANRAAKGGNHAVGALNAMEPIIKAVKNGK